MKQQKLMLKLNKEHNFHLSLKVIQFSEVSLLYEFNDFLINKNIYSKVIVNDVTYEQLQEAYSEKKVVLCDKNITLLLPLVCVISSDDFSIVKPCIPTYYHLKDNRIIQNLKTLCHKQNITFTSFKTKNELFTQILSSFMKGENND